MRASGMSQAIAGWSSFHVAVGSLGRQSLSLRHSMGRLPLCRAESGEARDRRPGSQGRARGRCDWERESGVRNQSRVCDASQARMAPPASTFNMPGHSSAQKWTSLPVLRQLLSLALQRRPVRGFTWQPMPLGAGIFSVTVTNPLEIKVQRPSVHGL
jgi:hypothetical protein